MLQLASHQTHLQHAPPKRYVIRLVVGNSDESASVAAYLCMARVRTTFSAHLVAYCGPPAERPYDFVHGVRPEI